MANSSTAAVATGLPTASASPPLMASPTPVDSALSAMASPTRRAVLELLQGEAKTVGQLTELLPMTQSAVSQHMSVLRAAGLVTTEQQGRRRLYSVDLAGLGQVRAWVDGFWDDVLSAFVDHVTETTNETPDESTDNTTTESTS